MAWSYRKRIKIIPGVHLNFSKNGISTSVGVRGASVTFGQNGTYLNTGIPGTGLYNRQRISFDNTNPNSNSNQQYNQGSTYGESIFSADVQRITSQDLQGIKEAIISAHDQRNELKSDLRKIKTSLFFSHVKLIASYLFIIGLVIKAFAESIKTEIEAKKSAIIQLTEQIENCYVDLDVDFDPDIKVKYNSLVSSFKNMCNSHKIWDVTSAQYEDRRVTRSAAASTVEKKEVRFGIKGIEDIKSNFEILWLKNANGADIYMYPSFIVMYSSEKSFALIGFNDIQFAHCALRFVETGSIPSDTKVVDKTWAKVNRDGSPDRRFKDNYEIPIVRYGQINFRTSTGMNEEYEISNYEFSEQFAYAFMDFQNTVRGLRQISGQYFS
jgi:hypothetical protein